jgi:hypothetical protein
VTDVGFQRYRVTDYLQFYEGLSSSGKTKVVVIYSRDVELLGRIKWMGRWRQYGFFPEQDTVWNPVCLAEVMEEIERLRVERKVA